MPVKIQKPDAKKSEGPLSGTVYTHPAFGQIAVHKTSRGGRGTRLHGSELLHHSTVRIEIKTGDVRRDLHQEWYHSGETLVSLEMSEAQWATFVSSIGMGEGTPVTLRYAPTEDFKLEQKPEIEGEPMTEKFKREIKASTEECTERARTIAQRMQQIAEAPGAVSKTDFKELAREMSFLFGNMPSNMAFINTQLTEAMENTVAAGKAELEAFARNTLIRAGMQKFAELAAPEIDGEPKKLPSNLTITKKEAKT